MSQTQWEKIVSDIAIETARELRRLADPRPEGDRVKAAIGRAARHAKLSYWRAYDLWYGRGSVKAAEFRAIQQARTTRHQEARNDLLALAADFTALAERASRIDPELARPWADAMREVAGRARRLAHGE